MSTIPLGRMICFKCYESYLYNSLIHYNVSYVSCFILHLLYLVKVRCPTVNMGKALSFCSLWTDKLVKKMLSA